MTFSTQDGVYIKGLYLQGAGWDKKNAFLVEANPMQLVCPMPTIQFKPVENKKKSSKGKLQMLIHWLSKLIVEIDHDSGF